MVKAEKAPEENPYYLSEEELTCPDGASVKERNAWFEEMISRQREGIDHGVRPQNLRGGLPKSFRKAWRSRVWGYYISKQPIEVQRIIRETQR